MMLEITNIEHPARFQTVLGLADDRSQLCPKNQFVISRHLRLAGDAEKPCVFFLDDESLGKATARLPATFRSS
jgi:hypothetical protein